MPFYTTLVIATYDSFIRAGISVARIFTQDENILLCIHKTHAQKKLSNQQLKGLQIVNIKIKYIHFNDLFNNRLDFLNATDNIIVSMGNNPTRLFLEKFNIQYCQLSHRPRTITVFPGVIFGDPESISARLYSDIILCNSLYDSEIACQIKSIYKLHTKIINFGLPYINIKKRGYKEPVLNEPINIFFIDQVKIPYSKYERKFIVNKLVKLAQKNPSKNFFIKTRISENEFTVHKDKHPYKSILNNLDHKAPSNIKIIEKDITYCFSMMDLCITISSTAAIEASFYGIPVTVLADLGIRKDLANQHFISSGLFANTNKVFTQYPLLINKKWYLDHVCIDDNRESILLQALLEEKVMYSEGHLSLYMSTSNFRSKLRKLIRSPIRFFLDAKLY